MQRNGLATIPFLMALLFCAGGLLAGCGGGGGGTTNASIPSAPDAPGGPVVPSRTPTPAPTTSVPGNPGAPTPQPSPSSQANLIYVALGTNQSSEGNPRVEAFPLSTSGNIPPAKTITQIQNDMPSPMAVAFDAAGNLYVGNSSYPGDVGSTMFVSVFAPGTSGAAPPIRTIGAPNGSTLGQGSIQELAFDGSGYLYVEGNNTVSVFAPNASGNVPPVRTFTSSTCPQIGGLAVTASGSVVVACDSLNGNTPQIETFAPGASGNATPASTISGSNTQLTDPWSVAISPLGFIVVLQRSQPGSILTFPITANGNVAPTTDITGSATGLTGDGGVTVDSAGDIYAINTQGTIGTTNSSSITEYAPTANGNAAPMKTIAGSNTGLTIGWYGIAIGPP